MLEILDLGRRGIIVLPSRVAKTKALSHRQKSGFLMTRLKYSVYVFCDVKKCMKLMILYTSHSNFLLRT